MRQRDEVFCLLMNLRPKTYGLCCLDHKICCQIVGKIVEALAYFKKYHNKIAILEACFEKEVGKGGRHAMTIGKEGKKHITHLPTVPPTHYQCSPEYGIQHGAECVHDVMQTANYSAMRLHYSAGKLHDWFTYLICGRQLCL